MILIGIPLGIVEFSLCRGTDCRVYFAVVRGWPASGFELHLPVVIHLGIWDDVVPLHLSTGCWNPVLFCRGMWDPTPHKGGIRELGIGGYKSKCLRIPRLTSVWLSIEQDVFWLCFHFGVIFRNCC